MPPKLAKTRANYFSKCQDSSKRPQNAPRCPQDAPKRPQVGGKMAPRWPQDAPKMLPRCPILDQVGFNMAQFGLNMTQLGLPKPAKTLQKQMVFEGFWRFSRMAYRSLLDSPFLTYACTCYKFIPVDTNMFLRLKYLVHQPSSAPNSKILSRFPFIC